MMCGHRAHRSPHAARRAHNNRYRAERSIAASGLLNDRSRMIKHVGISTTQEQNMLLGKRVTTSSIDFVYQNVIPSIDRCGTFGPWGACARSSSRWGSRATWCHAARWATTAPAEGM